MLPGESKQKEMVENGRWIPQKERLLARSRVFKFIAAPVIALSLVHWLFYVNELTKAVKMASLPLPWRSVVNNCSEQGEVYFIKRGFREDVITDGKREKMSVANSCPPIPPKLVGEIRIIMDIPSLQVVEDEFPNVMPGGRFRPKECTSRHRVAILVPYRNRTEHLKIFTYNIHKVLSRQQIDYGVFVIEQGDREEFNRAKLLNIGFVEATALYDYQCFVFHDVDMVPVDDRNVYSCPEQPRHLSVNVNNKSTIFYHYFFGGVTAVTKEQMVRVNGYSNKYWGWGAEDDDMGHRLLKYGYRISRRPQDVGRYVTLAHEKSKPSKQRLGLLSGWASRIKTDGLNSLEYKRLDMKFKKLYTWILVDLREPK